MSVRSSIIFSNREQYLSDRTSSLYKTRFSNLIGYCSRLIFPSIHFHKNGKRIEKDVNFTFAGEVELQNVTQGVCRRRQESPLISRFGSENRPVRRRLHNDLGRSCGPRHGTRAAPQLRNCQRRPICHRSLAREFLPRDVSPQDLRRDRKMPRPHFWICVRTLFGKREKAERARREAVDRFLFLSVAIKLPAVYLSRDTVLGKNYLYCIALSYYSCHRDNSQLAAARQKTPQVKSSAVLRALLQERAGKMR